MLIIVAVLVLLNAVLFWQFERSIRSLNRR